jgi:hypothetical protein
LSDWHYAQEKPTERLCKIEHYSMLKPQSGGDVEFLITVREYVNPPDPAMRFLAQADKQINQRPHPIRRWAGDPRCCRRWLSA